MATGIRIVDAVSFAAGDKRAGPAALVVLGAIVLGVLLVLVRGGD